MHTLCTTVYPLPLGIINYFEEHRSRKNFTSCSANLGNIGKTAESCLQNEDDPEIPFSFLKVSMILGSHLGKQKRKDSPATDLDAGAQLLKEIVPKVEFGLSERMKKYQNKN